MNRLLRRYFCLSLLCTASLAAGSAVAAEAPLAIRGYDPVAYFTLGKPVQGVAAYEYVWDERRYRFSSVEHRDLFKADPARYAPRFANWCAIALSRGEMVPANPEYWLISDGKLYLFGKAAGPAVFQKDPAGTVARASRNQP
jgi:YHS domain-containing protein